MGKASPVQNNFTAGELSPLLLGRFDIAKYANAAKTLENILIHQAGGGQRRPGTKFVAEVKTSSLKTRLITFEFSTTQTYIIELGNLYMRFYRNQGQITDSGSPVEISTPYLTADLFELQFAQDADTMFITHPSYKTRELTRTAHITWTLKNYAPELLTLDVAPGGAGWAVGETITGNTSGKTSIIVAVLTTLTYRIKNRDGAYTLGEVLTNQTDTADQGTSFPTFAGDPFGADGSDDVPSSVAMFEQRIVFANTNNNPQKVFASVSGDFQDMTVGTDAGDAFIYTIASDKVNAIRWLKSTSKSLQMGTLGSTFSMSSGADALAVTPTNVSVKRDTTYGAANILPEIIGSFIYYVERDLIRLRELGFSFEVESQEALDMTILSDHIAKAANPSIDSDGLTQIAYQQSPVSRLWCVRKDGQMAVLTRQIDQEVIGWSRQVSGVDSIDNGKYESVAIIPTDAGEDEVWVIVKRTVGGSTVRYVEFFMPESFDAQQDIFFVDSGLSLDDPKTITNIVPKTVIDDMEYASDAAARTAYPSSDPNFDSFTKLMLDFNGVDGVQSTTDASPSAHDVTFVGDAQLDTAFKKFGTASLLIPGTGGYLTIGDSSDWNLGAGNFTLRTHARFNSVASEMVFFGYFDDQGAANDKGWLLTWRQASNELIFRYTTDGTTEKEIKASWTPLTDTQYHVEVVRSGANLFMFIDGSQIGSTGNVGTDTIFNADELLHIGGRHNGGSVDLLLNGWLDNTRIDKGVARNTSDFTAPTAEYIVALQSFSEGTIITQGANSLKVIAEATNSLNDTLTRDLTGSEIDLSGIDEIRLSVRASRIGTNISIAIHDSGGTTTTKTITIAVADTFETISWDISGVSDANKDDIDSIIIKITNADADNTFYIDNLFGVSGNVLVTAASHGFSSNDRVRIVDVIGMVELNGESFIITKIDANTFTLQDDNSVDIDGSDFTAYISGGEVRKKVTAITGLTHLAGEPVVVVADGIFAGIFIVTSGGGITLNERASLVHVGLPYTNDIGLLPQIEGSATGTAVGKIQRIYKIILKLYNSLGFQYGRNEDNLDTKEITTLFTGDVLLEFGGDWDRDGLVLIRQTQPLPLNVLSATLITDVAED